MKTILSFLILLITSGNLIGQEAEHPIIPMYGGIYAIEGAVNPDTEMEYNIVIDLKLLDRDKESVNRGLNNVARMMNLHGLGGVKAENLNVAVVIHGGATDLILNNEAYQERYEVDNPNLELIDILKEAGVELYVCGQSLLSRNYAQSEVNPQITIGLSMLTVFTTYMNNGFVPLVFD